MCSICYIDIRYMLFDGWTIQLQVSACLNDFSMFTFIHCCHVMQLFVICSMLLKSQVIWERQTRMAVYM